MDSLLKGLLAGFLLAAPIGPVWVLCLRRTVLEGTLSGLAAGLGAALADAVYGAAAAFGTQRFSELLIRHHEPLRLAYAAAFSVIGLRLLLSRPHLAHALGPAVLHASGLAASLASAFALTLVNPMTLLAFGALFALLGHSFGHAASSAPLLSAGVFVGSGLWWLALVVAVRKLKTHLGPHRLALLNRATGLLVLALAAGALLR